MQSETILSNASNQALEPTQHFVVSFFIYVDANS
jgi:hypothetical protein